MERKADLRVEITAQAYAKDYYETLETTVVIDPGDGGECAIDADCPPGTRCIGGICVPLHVGGGGGCRPGIDSVTYEDGTLTIHPIEC